jgi:hypothetical protein
MCSLGLTAVVVETNTMQNAVFWMLRRVALVRTDGSGEHMAYIIRVKRISVLRTTLAVTKYQSFCSRDVICFL